MKKITTLLAFLLMLPGIAYAQTCGVGGLVFNNQASIDNFNTNNPGCTQIVGSVTISGTDIANLNGLSAITSISGDLTIDNNPLLTNLTGLTGLTGIVQDPDFSGGQLIITNNPALVNLTGLNNLKSIAAFFTISQCNVLTSLTGLASLETVGYGLSLSGCPLLTDLEGFDSLTSLGGLLIGSNTGLTSLDGLESLTSLGGLWDSKGLSNYDALSSITALPITLQITGGHGFTGLENVTSIGDLTFIECYSLSGLPNLKTVTGTLGVSRCYVGTLGDLYALESIGGILIMNNPVLSQCNIQSICRFLVNGTGPVDIANNGPGCSYEGISSSPTCQGVAAPTDIVNLQGTKVSAQVQLSWQTTSESGVKGFSVERGDTPFAFTAIGYVNSHGDSPTPQNYNYNDTAPGYQNYYRVKEEKLNGDISFSDIIFVEGNPPACPIGGITFATQASIDNFSVAYPGCAAVKGSVNISGNDITNLNGLSSITSIKGNLNINSSPLLQSLAGLGGLATVQYDTTVLFWQFETGNILINNLPQLTDLTGLGALNSVDGDIGVSNAASFTSLAGLQNLTSVGYFFSLNNTKLVNFNGLPNLTFYRGVLLTNNPEVVSLAGLPDLDTLLNVSFTDNPKLSDIGDLGEVTYIGGLSLSNNPSLADLSGLGSVEEIGELSIGSGGALSLNGLVSLSSIFSRVTINGPIGTNLQGLETVTNFAIFTVNGGTLQNFNGLNPAAKILSLDIGANSVTSLSALSTITSIKYFRISGDGLTSLAGLDNVDPEGIAELVITNASNLTDCNVKSVCIYLADPASRATISGNGAGCATRQQIVTSETCLAILPVDLVSFEGQNTPEGNKLIWKTASETQNKGFEIERSGDAKAFEKIGFVEGNADSKVVNTYSFTDPNPAAIAYYRLKQLDFDGAFEYSKIIAVRDGSSIVKVYPNPSRGKLHIESKNRNQPYFIKNVQGISILESAVLPSKPLDTSSFQNGLYLLTIGEDVFKVVVQN